MGRPPNPKARADLLERAAGYILERGLSDLSLRPLASAIGVSPRLLLYHFGSREHLIVEVLGYGQQRQQEAFANLMAGAARPTDGLRALWQHFTSPEVAPLIRLIFEVEALAMQGKTEYQAFARATLHGWTASVEAQLPGTSPARATLVVGVFSGLLLDFLVNMDRTRVAAAFEALLAMLEGGAS